ncbi:transcriptional regulator family: Fungal Specific TF [Paecilomyces variotii]|uniref:uncharacterized protein n=1 Tax=Penicillium rubens TaxID=1108849 RepID=UPI002A59F889|nr:uncharacterized protein N7525_007403 [Penicillium rubens]KAJ5829150.1 hypothetical protein N7525_007403 [Penicillium rubens]KAJ9211282.1 transcriptional regulator family: Fungal Specific TF [Paecilomyces variotii]KAJ9241851.1 transcriptional regulator family: Fungal Specific TF [Paecilomyces variotii]KAJ9309686.1 transcriptional regulator family: Fungal Specific TF [Paecilomyces variotii]
MEVTDPDQTTDNNGKDANFSQFASTYEIFSDHPKSNHRSLLLQKRQRVSRACDECRRRKIKCDGRQPCAHCTIYAYNCAYDQPSKRHRKPDPQYVEALEGRLHKAEAILRTVLPSSFDNESPAEKDPMHRLIHLKHTQTLTHETLADSLESSRENVLNAGKESLLETFPGDTGHLDLDDHKKWDYHGPTSGIFFVQRLRKQLGVVETPENRTMMQGSLRSTPAALFPHDGSLPPTYLLPSQTVVIRLCHNALGHASSFMCLVIEHHFFSSLGRIYDLPYEQLNNEDKSFLPLLYIATALGALFEVESPGTLNLTDYEDAIDHSLRFFKLGRRLLEITDCRDLTSLQAICFVVLFLQSSAKLSACYSYIGIALHAGLRLGIHRAVTTEFDPIEQELRKRIFWFIRTMDIFVSTMLGLPQLMSSDDIDQEYPICVDGRFITAGGIAQMPPDYTPLMAGCNALSRLGKVLLKLVKRIYPVSNADFRSKSNLHKIIDHSSIQEIERELETWIEELPPALRSTTEASPQFER